MIKEKRFNFDLCFKLLVVAGLSISLAMPLISGFGYRGTGFWISLLLTLLFTAIYYLFYLYPLFLLFFPVIFIFLSLLYLRNPLFFSGQLTAIFSLRQPADSLFWPLVIMALTVLLIFLMVFKTARPLPLLFGTGLVITAALWYLYVDSAYPATISYSLFWLLLLSYRRGAVQWSTVLEPNQAGCSPVEVRKTWLSYTLVVLFLALIGTLILPKNIAPLPCPALQNWAAEHFSFLQKLRPSETPLTRGDGGDFTLFAFGLQEEEELGGPLYSDNLILLQVSGRGRTYLRGTVMDSYSGRSWNDTTTFREAINLPRPQEKMIEYLAENTLTIRHLRLKTNTIFTGLYPQEIKTLPGSVLVNSGNGFKFSRTVPLNYEYQVKSYRLVYRPDPEQSEKNGDQAFLNPYLELPSTLPERVYRLARDLTAEEEGSYEKMKALEEYLRQHFRYLTDPPKTPPGRDFVDYFIFDLQEGYCTYFATALAVLGRAAGIPTRFVSGFVVPALPAANGYFYVAGTDAHTWIEAYIAGAGWLPFEATPGFATDSNLPARTGGSSLSYFSDPDAVSGQSANWRVERDLEQDLNGEVPGVLRLSEIARLIRRLLIAFLFSGLILTAALAMILLTRLRKVRRKLKLLDSLAARSMAVGYYNLTLLFLEKLNLGKQPGETPQEFGRRIGREVHLWNLDFRDLSFGVSLALYSKEQPSPRLAADMKKFFLIIFDRYLEEVGKVIATIEILLRDQYFHVGSDFPLPR